MSSTVISSSNDNWHSSHSFDSFDSPHQFTLEQCPPQSLMPIIHQRIPHQSMILPSGTYSTRNKSPCPVSKVKSSSSSMLRRSVDSHLQTIPNSPPSKRNTRIKDFESSYFPVISLEIKNQVEQTRFVTLFKATQRNL